MTLTKAIATPGGTQYVELTSEEITQREAEEEEWEAGRISRENALAEEKRRSAYVLESDPLFFKWQRGEVTEQEWLDKVDEIKQRYPKVEE